MFQSKFRCILYIILGVKIAGMPTQCVWIGYIFHYLKQVNSITCRCCLFYFSFHFSLALSFLYYVVVVVNLALHIYFFIFLLFVLFYSSQLFVCITLRYGWCYLEDSLVPGTTAFCTYVGISFTEHTAFQ